MTDERNDADEPQDAIEPDEDAAESAEDEPEHDDQGEEQAAEDEESLEEEGEDDSPEDESDEERVVEPPPTRKPKARDEREPKEKRRRRLRRRKDPPPEPEESEDSEEQSFWERGLGKRLEGIVPDVVKRTLVGSLGSMFLSEDGLRQSLAELRLPKEVVTFILQQADHTKREFMRIVANEMRDFLESTNFYDEMRKILTSLSFEIRTEVRLIPNDSAFVKPEVKNTVRVKRDGRDVDEPAEDES